MPSVLPLEIEEMILDLLAEDDKGYNLFSCLPCVSSYMQETYLSKYCPS